MSGLSSVAHLLPPLARELHGLIGIVPTLRLVEEMGGQQFPVSKNQRRQGAIRFERLAEVVGIGAAQAMTRHYGGCVISIPMCADALRELRDRELRADFDRITTEHTANHAVAVLNRKYRLTERHIWRIVKCSDRQHQSDARQAELF